MRRLLLLTLISVVLVMTGCRRNKAEVDYERFMEKTDTAVMEFIAPREDSVDIGIDGNAMEQVEELGGDDDGLMVIPDIPQERKVNMQSDSYELEKMMRGE